ncbi:MAG: Gfo/Idh/MocA family oxidoreductase [Planctomycetota bacterium]
MIRCSRRRFLGALAAAPFAISDASRRILGANERLRIGVVGVAGRGANNLDGVKGEQIAALCDADAGRLRGAAARHADAATFLDWRELLEQRLDAIVVSTPDHHHAPVTTRALARGLPVYCEKPLTHTVAEARRVRELAARAKVATQMGTQFHESPAYLRAKEILEADWLGPVREVHVITDRPGGWWKQGMTLPTERPEVPRDLWWDLWLGAAPERAYHPSLAHFVWRGWWDYGCGAVGDMAIHLMDLAVWALELGDRPVRVESRGGPLLPAAGPQHMHTTFAFPARGKRLALTVHWYEGTEKPAPEIAKELPMNGCLFIGSEGRMAVKHASSEAPVLYPEAKFAERDRPEVTHVPSPGHHRQWLDAIRGKGGTSSPFSYAAPFTELVLLANVSFRSGKAFDWDPESMTTGGAPEAARFLSKSYREGWELAQSTRERTQAAGSALMTREPRRRRKPSPRPAWRARTRSSSAASSRAGTLPSR